MYKIKNVICSENKSHFKGIDKFIKAEYISYSMLSKIADVPTVLVFDLRDKKDAMLIQDVKTVLKNVVIIGVSASTSAKIEAFSNGCNTIVNFKDISNLPKIVRKWDNYLTEKNALKKEYQKILNNEALSCLR